MQMFKETSLPNRLPAACLERRLYEEAVAPTNLLLIEQWSDEVAHTRLEEFIGGAD